MYMCDLITSFVLLIKQILNQSRQSKEAYIYKKS